MSKQFDNLFKLKKPCKNCPFLKEGGIELREGRLEEIIKTITEDDMQVFHCHKTVHNNKTGGEWNDEGNYKPSNLESLCAGYIIYLEKLKRPSVTMRIGRVLNMYKQEVLKKHFAIIIDPLESK